MWHETLFIKKWKEIAAKFEKDPPRDDPSKVRCPELFSKEAEDELVKKINDKALPFDKATFLGLGFPPMAKGIKFLPIDREDIRKFAQNSAQQHLACGWCRKIPEDPVFREKMLEIHKKREALKNE